MGTYRLILAICVAASHCGALLYGRNEGTAAVVSFLLLSGYVMTLLISKYYIKAAQFVNFYLDRCARLLPQFLFYTTLSVGALLFTPLGSISLPWVHFGECSLRVIAANFSLFGNNFYWLFGPCELIPASWSLGLEGFFYLAFPFILQSCALPLRTAFLVASALVFVSAAIGLLNFDIWAYRLLPGNLFVFLTGSSIAKPSLYPKRLPIIIWSGAVFMLILTSASPHALLVPALFEMLIGLIAGIPIVTLLAKRDFGRIDEMLGNISYGVFLNHLFVLWMFVWALHLNRSSPHKELIFIEVIGVSILLSLLTFFVIEHPLIAYRRSLRSTKIARFTTTL